MKTLFIETSAELGSVAISENGRMVAEETFGGGRGHAAHLFPLLERLLKTAGRIDQVVAGVGPGGYSGLRVGISAALGLKIGRGIPGHGISSALGFAPDDYQSVIDARGSWIFAEVRAERLVQPPILLDGTELASRLNPQLPLFAAQPLPGNVPFEHESPDAAVLARRFSLENALPLEPLYLKPPHITQSRQRPLFGSAATNDAR